MGIIFLIIKSDIYQKKIKIGMLEMLLLWHEKLLYQKEKN